MRGRSASDVRRLAFWFGLMTEDSSDEMYPLSSMEVDFLLRDRLFDEAATR
jgi:hypothetical protein